jgi:hypothetical protein
LVWAQEEHPVVIDNADAKTVKPTGSAKEVSVECWILGEEHGCRKLDAKRPYPILPGAQPIVSQRKV